MSPGAPAQATSMEDLFASWIVFVWFSWFREKPEFSLLRLGLTELPGRHG
jgi:hypothetical protein